MTCCGCMWKSGGEDLQGFYPVRSECQADVPRTRFKSRAGKTLSRRRWHAAFTEDGHLDMERVLRRIQRGGIHPSIKGEVWEFLLGGYDPDNTFDERTKMRNHIREKYYAWKEECNNMVPLVGSGKFVTTVIVAEDGEPLKEYSVENQEWLVKTVVTDKHVLQWMLVLSQIGLDVIRTNRYMCFYERKSNQPRLWDVLAIYTWLNPDIGYVQEMNDICSPMIILIEDEADAFWCFERAMRRLRENFRTMATSIGVQTQLGMLSQVIKTVDPRLHQHLDLDGGEYMFAIRMLMVLFRREFSFLDALCLREMMWAMDYNPNNFASYEKPENGTKQDPRLLKQYGKFERKYIKSGQNEQHHNTLAVFVVASVLETKNKRLLKEAKGLDDVVQVSLYLSTPRNLMRKLNSLVSFWVADIGWHCENLDARKACKEALKIHEKFLRKVRLLFY
ncbi:unnamed protein product [Eruca vesicaria subsp. sativa]|uniref:Rab-GAP TBC domain-containing protein n=1 Tax=Eruca vesicaria subsp. sativa TaxID=29727 RepID=A0ABC8K0M3_ERUVS|nr:unnamed protein product [Eruca vesicaria subsp. sativa]